MSANPIVRDYAWAATFDLLDCLRPVIPSEQVCTYFNAMFARVESAVAEAIAAADRERLRLPGCKTEK